MKRETISSGEVIQTKPSTDAERLALVKAELARRDAALNSPEAKIVSANFLTGLKPLNHKPVKLSDAEFDERVERLEIEGR